MWLSSDFELDLTDHGTGVDVPPMPWSSATAHYIHVMPRRPLGFDTKSKVAGNQNEPQLNCPSCDSRRACFRCLALVGVIVTSALAQRREHEADWRQTKIEHYQEYVTALSNIVSGRSTPAAQERYADAVNSLALVASPDVLDAVHAFQREISYRNTERSDARHDALLSAAMHAMRADVQPSRIKEPQREFSFLAPPPVADEAEAGRK